MAIPASISVAEVWRPVAGYEGLYEVSSLGRVRALDRTINVSRPRRLGGAAYEKLVRGRPLNPNLSGSSGYMAINLHRENRSKRHSLHVLVCAAFHGSRPADCVVAHNDGNRLNNAAANLRYATYSENALDKERHGTGVRGARNGAARLSEDDVRAIKRVPNSTPARIVAEQFGVSADCIRLIRLGDRWSHIKV